MDKDLKAVDATLDVLMVIAIVSSTGVNFVDCGLFADDVVVWFAENETWLELIGWSPLLVGGAAFFIYFWFFLPLIARVAYRHLKKEDNQ